MLYNFITINFAPLTGILFLLIFLFSNKGEDKESKRVFLLLVFLELAELLVYSAELWTATFTKPTFWRILFSAVGYSLRPVLLLCIPAIVNAIWAFSAFFTGLVYSYDENNQFVRGPLGYMTHFVLLLYLACILVFTFQKNRRFMENLIVWAICFIIVLAIVLEALFSIRSLGRTAIVLSTFAYYLYFQSSGYRKDLGEYMEQTIRNQNEHLRIEWILLLRSSMEKPCVPVSALNRYSVHM